LTSLSFPGPDDITRRELPNGIVVLHRANMNSLSVVVTGYLTAGSIFDEDSKLGLAGFTALALMRGTMEHDFQQVYDALESNGASFGVDGGTHSTGFFGNALAEDLDLLTGTLAEIVRQPAFPDDQVERLRAQLLTSLAIRAQDTTEVATLAFHTVALKMGIRRRSRQLHARTWLTFIKNTMAHAGWSYPLWVEWKPVKPWIQSAVS
jgi:zinc protease